MIQELDDIRTQAEIWGDKLANPGTEKHMGPVGEDPLLREFICYICERKWVGVEDEIRECFTDHHHDPVAHVRWYLRSYENWPHEFRLLVLGLIEVVEDSGIGLREQYIELNERLDVLRKAND